MVDLEAPKSSQEPPKSPPRAPKRSPREPQNAFKTIFGSKTLIFQKCKDSNNKINIFEGWRVSLGAQNRPQEAPRGDKKRHRRSTRPTNLDFDDLLGDSALRDTSEPRFRRQFRGFGGSATHENSRNPVRIISKNYLSIPL